MNKSLVLILLIFTTRIIFAQDAGVTGNVEQGKSLAFTCMGCHGQDGIRNAYPAYKVPKLGGQHEQYITIALKAYRSGERNHPTMRGHASSLSDEEIASIAAYFSSIKND